MHRLAALAAVTFVLTACGGSDEYEVRDTVEAFYSAYATGDGRTACSLINFHGEPGVVPPSDAECAADFATYAAKLDQRQRDRFRAIHVTSATVNGSAASARFEPRLRSGAGTVHLRKFSGEWMLVQR